MTLVLNEALSITLMTRFLNHLELLDSVNNDKINEIDSGDTNNDKYVSSEKASEHGDAVLKNLLAVGRFLSEHDEILWIGSDKRTKLSVEVASEAAVDVEDIPHSPPQAFTVLMDKVCKIGRKATRVLLIGTCLKFYAAILVSCEALLSNDKLVKIHEPVFMSMLKLIDHVQTFTISRDQVRKKEWRSALELAKALLERLKELLGEDLHSALNLKLVKSMSAAKIVRREEKRQLVLMDPEKAAKIKSKDNQRKYRARKSKRS